MEKNNIIAWGKSIKSFLNWQNSLLLIAFGFLAAVQILAAFKVNPGVIGLIQDSSAYLKTSESLAHGNGYQYNHWPMLKYPPLLSLFLVPGWWLQPQFPDNIILFRLMNASCFLLALVALVYWLKKRKDSFPLIMTVLLLTGLDFNLLWYNLNLFSESLYLFLSLLLIGLVEGHFEKLDKPKFLTGIILLSVALFYVRSIGIALIGSIGLYLLLKKHYRTAWIYIGSVGLSILPWVYWLNRHSPGVFNISGALFLPFNVSYGTEWQAYVLSSNFPLYKILWAQFTQGFEAVIQGLGGLFAILLTPSKSFYQNLPLLSAAYGVLCILILNLVHGLKERKISLSGIYLTLYLLMLPLWWASNGLAFRFLLLVLPFILRLSLQSLSRIPRKWLAIPALGLFCSLVLIGPYRGYANWVQFYSTHQNGFMGEPFPIWDEYQQTFQAIDRLSAPSDIFFGQKPGIFSLYTHRNILGYAFIPQTPISSWNQLMKLYEELFHRIHVRFVISDQLYIQGTQWGGVEKNTLEELIKRYPEHFKPIYQTPSQLLGVYEFQ